MSFAREVWDKLSLVNVNENTETRGDLTFLSWTWAWATLMNNYPDSTWEQEPEHVHPDGTQECRCTVTVIEGEKSLKRSMWLPVMDYRNNSIANPTSRQVSDTRMRCMVKCLSLFGLGHYIYAGSDLPRFKTTAEWVEEYSESVEAIQAGLLAYDTENPASLSEAAEEWYQLPEEAQRGLWVAPTKDKDAPFTTPMRKLMKEPAFRVAYFGETENA